MTTDPLWMDLDAPIPDVPNFTRRELVRTQQRDLLDENARVPIALTPACDALGALIQAVRGHYARPVVVHSGYRSPRLNLRVGGSSTSQHMRFEAVDFHVVGKGCDDVWRWLAFESGIQFGQCLLEGYQAGRATWVHLSLGAPWYTGSDYRRIGASEDGGKSFTWFPVKQGV